MRAMTDPQSGTRAYRVRVATEALAKWRAWVDDDQDIDPPFATFGELASCARWLLEAIDAPSAGDGPDVLGKANLAIAHLSNRECRDTLSLLAMRRPGAVLAAISEAGF